MEKEIILKNEVRLFLDELMFILFDQGYFGFPDLAKAYVDKLIFHIGRYVGVLPGKETPLYFVRYGKDLQYITYHANKSTTWYILYQQQDNQFLICHITNNHVAGQYFT